jgi:hypothetical protein
MNEIDFSDAKSMDTFYSCYVSRVQNEKTDRYGVLEYRNDKVSLGFFCDEMATTDDHKTCRMCSRAYIGFFV